ncbi:Glucosamine-phosphate N-acetyltransferase-like protein [Toensbergia leucococca]|nr:Glucosamine-phosphate N-acetyltransferase-like protein [Toensbergia leucococca]
MWKSRTNSLSVTGPRKDSESSFSRTPLFPVHYISSHVASMLPPNYSIRPLHRADYHNGVLSVLRVLTTVGEISEEAWNDRYDWMAKHPDEYFILVILNAEQNIVGTGSVIVERKFIHNCGQVGHIEDIAVAKDQQGMKLGLRLIEALIYISEKVGCYKTILDCSEANEGFYVKCGYKRTGMEMARYAAPPRRKSSIFATWGQPDPADAEEEGE